MPVYKDRDGRYVWESYDSVASLLSEDGRPYWLRTPPTPPVLRRAGLRKPMKDPETLELFPLRVEKR